MHPIVIDIFEQVALSLPMSTETEPATVFATIPDNLAVLMISGDGWGRRDFPTQDKGTGG